MAEEARAVAELSAAVVTLTQALARSQAENEQLKAAVQNLYQMSGRGPQRRTLARRGG